MQQILIRWLGKLVQEPPKVPNTGKNQGDKDPIEIVGSSDCGIRRGHLKGVEKSGLNCHGLSLFYFLRRKDVSEPRFLCTINLRRLRSFSRRQHSVHMMNMKKEDVARGLVVAQKAEPMANVVGNKVLPVTETAPSSSANKNDRCSHGDNKEKGKGNKTKTISRMKELLKWAAAAKAEKGGKFISRKVLHFRNRTALKAVPDDDQLSNDSPKISFRWDMDSCSTTSSVYSALSVVASSLRHDQIRDADSINSTPLHVRDQCVARSGSWITTDSEFVVLEL